MVAQHYISIPQQLRCSQRGDGRQDRPAAGRAALTVDHSRYIPELREEEARLNWRRGVIDPANHFEWAEEEDAAYEAWFNTQMDAAKLYGDTPFVNSAIIVQAWWLGHSRRRRDMRHARRFRGGGGAAAAVSSEVIIPQNMTLVQNTDSSKLVSQDFTVIGDEVFV